MVTIGCRLEQSNEHKSFSRNAMHIPTYIVSFTIASTRHFVTSTPGTAANAEERKGREEGERNDVLSFTGNKQRGEVGM